MNIILLETNLIGRLIKQTTNKEESDTSKNTTESSNLSVMTYIRFSFRIFVKGGMANMTIAELEGGKDYSNISSVLISIRKE